MAPMPWVDKMVAVPYPMGCDLAIYTWSVGHGTDALARYLQLATVPYTVTSPSTHGQYVTALMHWLDIPSWCEYPVP